jgi:PAS domain S-box-containing protein
MYKLLTTNSNFLPIMYECMESIGDSLDLKEMLERFLTTIMQTTGAKSAMAFQKENLAKIIAINEKDFLFDIKSLHLQTSNEYFEVISYLENKFILAIVYEKIICLIAYEDSKYHIDTLGTIFLSYTKKINSSINACHMVFEYKDVKDRLELAIQGANDGLWDWDIITNKVFFSPRWKSMLGYEDDEIPNQFEEWTSRVHPDDLEKALENIDSYILGKIDKFENIHRLKHKDGHWVWILDRGKAYFKNGKAIRMVGFHTDISNQKQLETQLELKVIEEIEKNKQKDHMLQQQSGLAQMGEMISMIAHQWRQPLASIASIAVTMKLKIALSKFDLTTQNGIDEFLKYINNEVDDVENLVQMLTNTIDDFRNFYKPDKEFAYTTIDSPIKKVLSILKPQLEQENIILNIEYLSTKNTNIYENEMVQVFLNILKNSLDNFQEKKTENPTINIKTEDIIGKVIVSICDNGGGINEDIISFIFDPYFSTKKNKNGTGLGLYMSKTIVEQHHQGKLSAINKSDGICFYTILEQK